MRRIIVTRHSRATEGSRYISERNPEINYKKLIEGCHIIIYRELGNIVYVNRVFDNRQNPES